MALIYYGQKYLHLKDGSLYKNGVGREGKQSIVIFQKMGLFKLARILSKATFQNFRKQAFTPFIQQLTKAFPALTETVTQHIKSLERFCVT